MKKKIIYIVFILSVSTLGYSQEWSRYKYELFYGVGLSNFMGDVSAPSNKASFLQQTVWVKFWNTIGYTANGGIRYNYRDRHSLTAGVFLGQLYAEDPKEDEKYWDRGIKTNTFFTEISARYEYMLWKEKKKVTVYRKLGESSLKNFSLPTYLFIGAGANVNLGKFTKQSADGKYLLNEFYVNAAPVVPFGFGFKFKLNRLTYLTTEASWRVSLSDGIDHANHKNNAAYGVWIDQYQTITFNLVHKLRQNPNGMPKLKRRN